MSEAFVATETSQKFNSDISVSHTLRQENAVIVKRTKQFKIGILI
jgi:hypothetical protein